MPSIAGFIQSLLSEDMYATGMLEKTDERISQLNAGQLRLLIRFVENKIPGLTNTTVLDAYTNLLRRAAAEGHKRHEEEVRGERERLSKLKAAHAGVNAKAWDTSHANLDRELAKFQKFLKSKARRVAEEEVLQEEMEKLHLQLLALPERRAIAETKRHGWWALGAVLFAVVGPILILCLLPTGVFIAVAAFLAVCVLAAACGFIGVLRGMVVQPALDDDVIEDKTRKRAKETLKGYRAEVRRTFEATEKIFAADMKWRDEWVERRKQERREERQRAKKGAKEQAAAATAGSQNPGESPRGSSGSARIFPAEEREDDGSIRETAREEQKCSSGGQTAKEGDEGSCSFGPKRAISPHVGLAGEPDLDGEVHLATVSTEKNSEEAPPQPDPQILLGAGPGRSWGSEDICGAAAPAAAFEGEPGLATTDKPGGSKRVADDPVNGSDLPDDSRGNASDGRPPPHVRARGPCQGSCLLEKPEVRPEHQDHRPPSVVVFSGVPGAGAGQAESASPMGAMESNQQAVCARDDDAKRIAAV